MKKRYVKKYLAVAVILLFIGVAFAPSIHANISKEMVEFTTEVCGLNGGKHTVKLTQEEADEVEALFDSIRKRLNEAETREEAEEIFKEAVVELDKYGLLGGLSVKQAQKLVTGGFQNSRAMRIIERMYDKSQGDINRNFLCLIAGYSKTTTLAIPFPCLFLLVLLDYYTWNIDPYLPGLFKLLFRGLISCLGLLGLSTLLLLLSPVKFLSGLAFGYYDWMRDMYEPATGWVYTIGSSGVKNWTGEFYGSIFQVEGPLMLYFCIGSIGFTGIIIKKGFNGYFIIDDSFYLGSTLSIKLSYETPNL